MTEKVWQHGSWAKVGDLVRVLARPHNDPLQREHSLVMSIDDKKFAGRLVNTSQWGWIKPCFIEVYKPNFDYDSEVQNG